MGVFATDTVGHLEFPGTKWTFGYNIVREKIKCMQKVRTFRAQKIKWTKKSEDILYTKFIVDTNKD